MNTIEKHKTYIEKFQELNGKKQMIRKPEAVMINSNKTDRQYLVRYTALTKYLEEMMTLQHLGQQFTRRALRKWCKKNTITEPRDLSWVGIWLDDYINSWDDITKALHISIYRHIHQEAITRRHAALSRFDVKLKHVRLDQHHIYFNEKIRNLKLRDKQRFLEALNKLIEDFEPKETWEANHGAKRREAVIERLLDKWKDEQ